MTQVDNSRRDAILRLHADGMSDHDIAKALGVTKNSVIGTRYRLNLAVNRTMFRADGEIPENGWAKRRMKAMVIEQTPRRSPAPKLTENLPCPRPLGVHPILTLTATSCRWPIGNPQHEDFRYCLETKLDGGPYCERHFELAYKPYASSKINLARSPR